MRDLLPPATLGAIGAHDWLGAVCLDCRHRATLRADALAARLGPDTPLATLPRRLICSGGKGQAPCGSRRVLVLLCPSCMDAVIDFT